MTLRDIEVTKDEAQHILGVSLRTIDRYISAGKLTAVRYHNGRVHLIRSEVEALAKPVTV